MAQCLSIAMVKPYMPSQQLTNASAVANPSGSLRFLRWLVGSAFVVAVVLTCLISAMQSRRTTLKIEQQPRIAEFRTPASSDQLSPDRAMPPAPEEIVGSQQQGKCRLDPECLLQVNTERSAQDRRRESADSPGKAPDRSCDLRATAPAQGNLCSIA